MTQQAKTAVERLLNRSGVLVAGPAEGFAPQFVAIAICPDQEEIVIPCSVRQSLPQQDEPAVGGLLNRVRVVATSPSEGIAPEFIAVAVRTDQPEIAFLG